MLPIGLLLSQQQSMPQNDAALSMLSIAGGRAIEVGSLTIGVGYEPSMRVGVIDNTVRSGAQTDTASTFVQLI